MADSRDTSTDDVNDVRENRRAAERTRVFMSGTLVTAKGSFDVRVKDVSTLGVQLRAPTNIPGGGEAVFKRGSLFAPAHIVWSKDGNCALRFYFKLTENEVAELFNGPKL